MLESVIKVVQRTLAYEDLKIRFSHRQDYSKSLNGRFILMTDYLSETTNPSSKSVKVDGKTDE